MKLRAHLYNAIGGSIAVSDAGENLVNKSAYAPLGEISDQVESAGRPFKFVGRYGVMTEPNGFYYMRARYYDPEAGRFVSEDPLGFEGGDVNLYVYGANNPVMFIDPWGLCYEDSWLTPQRALRWSGGLIKEFGPEAAGTVIKTIGLVAEEGSTEKIIGIAIGGGVGVLLTSPIPIPGARVVGGIAGGMAGGAIGGYFDPDEGSIVSTEEELAGIRNYYGN